MSTAIVNPNFPAQSARSGADSSLALPEFSHFMLKEIYEQPAALQTCLATYLDAAAAATPAPACLNLDPALTANLQEVHIIACGTSRHAGLVAQYWFEQLAGIPTRIRSGSEFQEAPLPLTAHTLTIAVTQSGETADTLGAVELEKRRRGSRSPAEQPRLLGITNQPDSRLAQLVDRVLPTWAGTEIGVAATKTFTTQLLVFYVLALHLAQQRQRLTPEEVRSHLAALTELPTQMKTVLALEPQIAAIAQDFVNLNHCVVLGRGVNRAIALEGALKLKETTYLHAEGYAAGEFMHGPIALLDQQIPLIAIVPNGKSRATSLANLHKAKSHGSPIIGIAIADNSENYAPDLFDHIIRLPSLAEDHSPFLTVIPLQLLAYHLAVARGLNVDRPRNITKTLSS